MSNPVYLFTDIVPQALQKIGSPIVLVCSAVQGISPSNTENWTKLVRQISQQNWPGFRKNVNINKVNVLKGKFICTE